jgi:phosphomannomutase/phosphoglucomutase
MRPEHRVGQGASLWRYGALIGAAGAAGIALAAALLWFQFIPAADQTVRTTLEAMEARQYSAALDGRLLDLQRLLARAAEAPQVVAALRSGDEAQIRSVAATLTATLAPALRVELFTPGTASEDRDAAVPISFAGLALINRAGGGTFAGPEAIVGNHRLVYAAQPVTAGGRQVGVLFVALAPDYFLEPMAGLDPSRARLVVEQTFGQEAAVPFLTWGSEAATGAVQRVALAVPEWALVYQSTAPEIPAALPGTAVLAVLGVALGVLLAGTGLVFARLHSATRADAARLRGALTTTTAIPGPYRLALFAELGAIAVVSTSPDTGSACTSVPTSAPPQASAAPPAASAPVARAEPLPVSAAARERPDAPDSAAAAGAGPQQPAAAGIVLEPQIFGAYGIHGDTRHDLTAPAVYWIGRAFAAEALAADRQQVAVGRDGRHSSLPLRDALVRGLAEGGLDVLDVGPVPTPLLYFATVELDADTAIMITGAHNPPAYNGLKMVLGGEPLAGDRIQTLRRRIEQNRLSSGQGAAQFVNLTDAYLDRVEADVVVAQPLKVVVDCGNGIAGTIAPALLARLDCDIIPLYCEVEGDFPHHCPDPADPTTLEDLITVVRAEQADIGLAFDGDGTSLGVVTASGRIIPPDRLLMLFAQDVVGRNPGADVIYDVKCSRHLNTLISDLGGRPILWKTGHPNLTTKLRETGALLAGEFSGHIYFGERWYGFDDALYAAARLLEIMGSADGSADVLFDRFPKSCSTPELRIAATERDKVTVMTELAATADFGDGTLTTIDGLRVDYPDGWGLIRAANTRPALTLRFEADSEAALQRIAGVFQTQLAQIDPQLKFQHTT